MAFGGFNKEANTAPMAEINMVPLIDVMLVLLVIFILTAPLLTHAVKVELPHASSAENHAQPRKIEIAIDDTGSIYWDGERIAEQALGERLTAASRDGEGKVISDPAQLPEIHLRADRQTAYEILARVMAASARAGLTKFAFVSTPE
ncbi:MAG: biopolymer transporter ExbD [Rhodocyclaceae bacterium]